jgi:hypothetical protein
MTAGKAFIGMGMAALLAAPTAGRAQDQGSPIQGKWSMSLRGGLDGSIGGDVHGGGTGSVLGLPTTVLAKNYGDIYGTAFRGEAQLGYGVSDRAELFVGGSYLKKGADLLQVGDVAGLELNAQFEDYEEIGVEAGMRYYFAPEATVKPYFTVLGGLRFIKANSPTFTVPAASVTLADVPFYDSSTVGTGAAGIGMRYDVSRVMSIGLEGLIRYQGRPEAIPTLAGTGLESINDAGERWSVPVLFTVGFRF